MGHFEIGEKCFFSSLDMILRFCTPSYMDGDGFFETVQKVRAEKEAEVKDEETRRKRVENGRAQKEKP